MGVSPMSIAGKPNGPVPRKRAFLNGPLGRRRFAGGFHLYQTFNSCSPLASVGMASTK
jgi:hypothetical protein